ncbi:Glucanosyltransferase-domain-containing protein [Lasiosphaeria miniovina]|uniref:1,3-beta-glucanosyltransferase n=1 Tax=Lasiosphaeria miniovina TaxID=1954250 RepID=A0AA40DK25_9PEZI|nr:Glucanosyltransferase-domain-containing protein [Lasiosphaeria miniovina]KAK0706534.1 Glucanosyltransferase-domain-containing protein [Lasiosphaeria miniovina]
MKFSGIAAAAILGVAATNAVETISAVGNKFFLESGKQFFVKGVAYQLVEEDPLVDGEQCSRDAALMKTLGTNTIRVYHVDATKDHTKCMNAFADAGIYTLIDLDTFDTYILPNAPSWNQTQVDAYAAVMDAFIKYDNVLGFFVGNEIIAIANQSLAAPYIKASVRDVKKHRESKGYRKVPIGYSAADIAELRPMLQDYLTCGGDDSQNVDFFALNSYEWCDVTTYDVSGYANLQKQAVNFPVPIFFSETGCNVPGPRLFDDQQAIFGKEMSSDWSGAIIYEWIEEANHYGLISYGPPVAPTATGSNIRGGFSRAGTPTPVSPDFNNLKSQWAKITPSGVAQSDYSPSLVSTRACPASTQDGWLVNGNVALPSIGQVFTGALSTVPIAIPTTTTTAALGSAATTSTTKNPAPANKEIAGMSAGLAGVMLFFTFWL